MRWDHLQPCASVLLRSLFSGCTMLHSQAPPCPFFLVCLSWESVWRMLALTLIPLKNLPKQHVFVLSGSHWPLG